MCTTDGFGGALYHRTIWCLLVSGNNVISLVTLQLLKHKMFRCIYDRSNINHPASGVNTKVAEIINHNGSASTSQGVLGNPSTVVGSGDFFWW